FLNILNQIYERTGGKLVARVAFENVGKMINDWYGFIRQHNIEQATKMKKEIQDTLPNMKENQNVLLYFNLIDSRFKLMVQDYTESGNLLNHIKSNGLESCTDDMIQYYFYFFSGLYEFYKKRFTKAINLYRIAESRLHKIPDEIEKAEFNYQVAIAYYEIRQNFFSLSHAEKAYDSFKAHEDYTNRVIKSKMLFAMNKVDLQQWDEAKNLYKDAIIMASKVQDRDTEALGHYNLGLCLERQQLLQEAKDCFKNALTLIDPQKFIHLAIRSIYMLSRVFYKTGSIEGARDWWNKALSLAEKVDEDVYKAKLNIIFFIYDKSDSASLDLNMNVLKEKNLWSDVADLSINAALYFKKQENTDLSSKYFEEACKAKDEIIKITEALE
ncbi:aspartate phosphatase, partial [Bacillus haynesii]|uniref:Rap family tetratricopeptide repeat protein n=1 Tax=Bacillus haynesii TaxID=1925021 RepID=UPI00228187A3